MKAQRQVGVPLDHITAEIAVFPFASPAGLDLALTELDPRLGGASGSGALWRAAENVSLGAFPAFSVDEITALRDRLWFADWNEPEGSGAVALERYLRRLAGYYLEARGDRALPRLLANGGELTRAADPAGVLARRAWRWLSLAIPPDLLLAALGSTAGGPGRVELLSPTLARHLADHGYSESHLHMGVAMDFPMLWVVAQRAVGEGRLRNDAFAAPAAELDEGRLIAPWLLHGCTARNVLARFLAAHARRDRDAGDLHTFLTRTAFGDLLEVLGASGVVHLSQALEDVERGTLRAPAERFRALQRIYAELSDLARRPRPGSYAAQMADDPVDAILPGAGRAGQSAEIRFVAEALAYLEGAGAGDGRFRRLFWQVVRIRVLLYRHVVHRPMVPGLQWFIRYYGHSSPLRKAIRIRTTVESAAAISGFDKGLRSLELRTSPAGSRSELWSLIRQVGEFAAEHRGEWDVTRRMEVGLVLHFTKDRGGGTRRGTPGAFWEDTHANPLGDRNLGGYRFAHPYREKLEEARTLARIIEDHPRCLLVLRGMDVCTDETGVPNWVFAPLVRRVRDAAHAAARAIDRLGCEAPGFHTTVHAGEDFVHLLTGMRQLDEAIDQLCLGEGDRLGHALSLGVEPRTWASRAGRIAMAEEDRLLDVVWEWAWYGREGVVSDAGRVRRIEYEIATRSEAIFERPVSPSTLACLLVDRADETRLARMGFPDGAPPDEVGEGTREWLLKRYLTDPVVFRRGRRVVLVDPDDEAAALAHLQDQLRDKVGTTGLTVEVNPTSNLLIGDLGDFAAHPLWRLRPPREDGATRPVSICVGSDDPLVFNSNVREEYQWLHDALVVAGLGEEEALRWLDRTRATGLETRFTLAGRWPELDEPAAGVPGHWPKEMEFLALRGTETAR